MKIERSALVTHSALDMYGLVADVLSYPQFLSWCTDSQVHEQTTETQEASLTVVVAGIKQQFTTLNTLSDGEWVKLELMKAPFR